MVVRVSPDAPRKGATLGYLPALDGIRGVAMIGIPVQIATAHGALMVLETKPCQSTGEQPDGSPWPQDSPARQDAYNALLHEVAAQHPGEVYVQDLNSYVCPGGTYTENLDGVPVRESDGSHFDVQPGGGGDYLAPAILPYWVDLGHMQEARTNGASVPSGSPPRFFAPQ